MIYLLLFLFSTSFCWEARIDETLSIADCEEEHQAYFPIVYESGSGEEISTCQNCIYKAMLIYKNKLFIFPFCDDCLLKVVVDHTGKCSCHEEDDKD
jgi:hypothetical protein